jgi:hypothetical protein
MVVIAEVAVSGLQCCVVLVVDTDVSEEHAASGFRLKYVGSGIGLVIRPSNEGFENPLSF